MPEGFRGQTSQLMPHLTNIILRLLKRATYRQWKILLKLCTLVEI
jgi:CTP synthase (UTP-ammonia lyase)